MSSVVPPLTDEVADEITCPTDDRLLEHRARDRRAHGGVLEPLPREIEVGARLHELRLRVRVVERRGFVLGRR